jgi:hypothetical protein
METTYQKTYRAQYFAGQAGYFNALTPYSSVFGGKLTHTYISKTINRQEFLCYTNGWDIGDNAQMTSQTKTYKKKNQRKRPSMG